MGLSMKKLEGMVDEALSTETTESLNEFLESCKDTKEGKAQEYAVNDCPWKEEDCHFDKCLQCERHNLAVLSHYNGFLAGYEAAEKEFEDKYEDDIIKFQNEGKEICDDMLKEARERSMRALVQIDLTDMDAPIFTHTKQFMEHFKYIKKQMTFHFLKNYDNEKEDI